MLWTLAMTLIGQMPKSSMPAPSSNNDAPWRVGTSADNHTLEQRERHVTNSLRSADHTDQPSFIIALPPFPPPSKPSTHFQVSQPCMPCTVSSLSLFFILFCYTCYFSKFLHPPFIPATFPLLYLFSCSCTACITLMRATV